MDGVAAGATDAGVIAVAKMLGVASGVVVVALTGATGGKRGFVALIGAGVGLPNGGGVALTGGGHVVALNGAGC